MDISPSREFPDADGSPWTATVRERSGTDYKGRFYFFVQPSGGSENDGFALDDVRWNSLRTAERTLRTMSEVELRRRLRSAVNRGRTPQSVGGPAEEA